MYLNSLHVMCWTNKNSLSTRVFTENQKKTSFQRILIYTHRQRESCTCAASNLCWRFVFFYFTSNLYSFIIFATQSKSIFWTNSIKKPFTRDDFTIVKVKHMKREKKIATATMHQWKSLQMELKLISLSR